MKINILFEMKDQPTGGGNQFLKALKYAIEQNGLYSKIEDADIVLFNSHQYVDKVMKCKEKYPDKLFIHRIDGPMRLYNVMSDKRDFITNSVNKYIADGTIFQSKFSRRTNYELGLEKTNYETIIYNTPNENIFYEDLGITKKNGKKVKLIATSWSSNPNKGFDIYQFLDEKLDFLKYEMTFIGNSPVEFKNIIKLAPLPSEQLAQKLRESDIYVSASKKEPCSNAILEAMNCGLPVIVRNDGGNPELIGESGLLFDGKNDILEKIDIVNNQYEKYRAKLKKISIQDKAKEYISFCEKIYRRKQEGLYKSKKLSLKGKLYVYYTILRWKLDNHLGGK